MAKARLMDRPEDYERLGVDPFHIEKWEDGIRIDPVRMTWEWWYFDFMMDDGTKAVIQFFSKSGGSMYKSGYHPTFTIDVTMPDGTEHRREPSFPESEATWSREMCDVRYGPHGFAGDLEDYSVFVDPIDGLGADLHLHSLSRPYRPGSAYISFGEDDRWYTWLCAVPKGEVTGTLTVEGREIPVHGFGYHDHQWGNVNFLKEWNHWVWARQNFGDYSLLVFDMVSNGKTGFSRFPLMFLQDAEGNLVMENTRGVECEVLGEYHDENSGKDYPKGFRYVFENGGARLEYTLEMNGILECNGKGSLSASRRALMAVARIDPAYTRYSATGRMRLTVDGKEVVREGELIYEFMYPGKDYRDHM
ncbi:MAG: hypothetical protein Q4Q58_03695 [Thermoplasmata archaeon]|nr:hypothetical protein [Thermoplasmata archaeon]